MDDSIHPITDAGRRLADAHEDARARGGEGRFLAVRLADGGAEIPGNLEIFDTAADVNRHYDDPAHAFLMVNMLQMPPAEATRWLETMRRLAAGGFKLTDPGTPRPIPQLLPNRADRRRLTRVGPMFINGKQVDPAFAALLAPHLRPAKRSEQ